MCPPPPEQNKDPQGWGPGTSEVQKQRPLAVIYHGLSRESLPLNMDAWHHNHSLHSAGPFPSPSLGLQPPLGSNQTSWQHQHPRCSVIQKIEPVKSLFSSGLSLLLLPCPSSNRVCIKPVGSFQMIHPGASPSGPTASWSSSATTWLLPFLLPR